MNGVGLPPRIKNGKMRALKKYERIKGADEEFETCVAEQDKTNIGKKQNTGFCIYSDYDMSD